MRRRPIRVLGLFVNDTARLSPPERFNSLLEGLFSDLATRAANAWVPVPPHQLVLIKLIWRRLRRMSRRFAAILARWHAGTLVAARSAPRRAAAARPAGSMRWQGLSQRFGWVIHAVSWFVNVRHFELKEMLEDPEAAALVAAAPELGRVLRPLCQMLAVPVPDWLRLPRRARRRLVVAIPPAPAWLLAEPGAIVHADGTVWMRFGASTKWTKPGLWDTLEEAQRFDPPIQVWPRD